MRLVLFLTCCLVITSYGNSFSQHQTVTLNLKEIQLPELFREIRNQTGLRFLFDAKLVKKMEPITVKAENKPVKEVLEEVLSRANLRCEFGDEIIMLIPGNNQQLQEKATRRISGVVTDNKKIPLPGATILIKNTTVGTVSNSEGKFAFSIPEGNHTLLVSFIGYHSREIILTDKEHLEIVLQEEESQMDEVVVTGYTTIDKRLSASAVTTLKAEDVLIPNVNTIDKMLQGQVPGLMVTNTSGSPNATPRIRLRGSATIHGSAAPVWVIDGIIWEDPVQISNDELNNIISGTQSDLLAQANDNASLSLLGNAITGLNPNDIETITFLKDASATAIYGTNAANGVIVVTTKQGKVGRPSLGFSASFGFTAKPRYQQYQLMNSKERIGVSRAVVENRNLYESMPYRTSYEGALFDLYDNLISKDQFDRRVAALEVMNTDWFDLLFQHAVSQDYIVNVSGGSDQHRYYVSASYGDSRGSSQGDKMNRYGLNMNMTTKFGQSVDVNWRINYSNRKSEGFYMVNPLDYALKTSRAIDPEESYVTSTSTMVDLPTNYSLSYNIFNELAHTGNTVLSRQANASVDLTARLLQGLTFKGTLGINYSNTQNRKWAGERSYYIATIRGYDFGAVDPNSDEERLSALPKGGILLYSSTDQTSYTARAQLNYNAFIGDDHTLNASGGFEMRSVEYVGFDSEEWGYFPDRGEGVSYEYDGNTAGANWPYGKQSSLDKHKVKNVNTLSNSLSLYATVAYGYRNRYIFNANVRSDASNRFGQYTNNRFMPIWSLAGRWSISQEEWLKYSRQVNDLSLRLSLGIQGTVPTSVGPNLIVKYPSPVTNRFTGDYILTVSRYPYPDLRWEKSKTWNLGLDFSLFGSRVNGTLDYYYKKTRDVVFMLDVPAEYGVTGIYRNGADVKNTGFELSLSFTPVKTRDFRWTLSTIYSKNSNNIDNTGDQEYGVSDYLSGNAFREGKPVTGLYAWEFTGLNPDNGIAMFAGTAPYSETVEQSDDPTTYLKYCGQRDPKTNGGFNTQLQYKQLSLSGQFAFAFGHVKRLNFLFDGALKMPLPHNNLSSELLKRWKQPGDEALTDIPGFVYNGETADYMLQTPTGTNNSYSMYNYSTARVVKADFFRCRNLSLSYYFTENQLPAALQQISCSFNVTNPFTICSKKLNGQDPEIDSTGSTALPITRSYSLSININF